MNKFIYLCFHAFNHSNCTILRSTLLEASLRPRDSMSSLFFWKLKFNVKEKLLLKLETMRNTEISGPPCAFLICVVTSRVIDFKYACAVFFFLLRLYQYCDLKK